jgi:hypothetical protein
MKKPWKRAQKVQQLTLWKDRKEKKLLASYGVMSFKTGKRIL